MRKDKIKVTLTITMHVDLNGASKLEVQDHVNSIPEFLANRGYLSGENESTIDDWSYETVVEPIGD